MSRLRPSSPRGKNFLVFFRALSERSKVSREREVEMIMKVLIFHNGDFILF